MACIAKLSRAAYLLAFLVAALWSPGQSVAAQTSTRVTTLVVPYIEYEWWLMSWSGNQFLCQVLIDHDGLPTLSEVSQACSAEIANAWAGTPACKTPLGCKGVYMHLIGSQAQERQVIVELPQPEIWVSLEGCTPQPPENRCTQIPSLVLTGIEPLPNERITAIQGILDGEPFYCLSDVCIIPPNSFALARTVEYFRIPRNVLVVCLGKSTYARCGIIVNVTPLEPEWEGHVTLEFSNTTPLPARIYANEGIAQMLFFESDEVCATSYRDRGGKYQGQTGVTLPKI